MSDKERGLYPKYTVYRNDGRDQEGQDRASAEYFVLDLKNDPYARSAINAYIRACKKEYPALAKDLKERVEINDSV